MKAKDLIKLCESEKLNWNEVSDENLEARTKTGFYSIPLGYDEFELSWFLGEDPEESRYIGKYSTKEEAMKAAQSDYDKFKK